MPAVPDLFSKLMALAKRRGFLWPSYEIYGGVAGFYDYGPMGAQLKAAVEALWRRYYVVGEGFAELSAPAISPEAVFKASGHLDKFSDVMTECRKCGEAFRADHLMKDTVPDAGTMNIGQVAAALKQHGFRCPECKGELSEPFPFNLMFRTSIGPGLRRTGYLRPETAQAMFVDFGLLYHHFREKLPFGAVQIGRGYRNEIAPRQGTIRMREFNMAEAEIFFEPDRKGSHPRFAQLARDILWLVPNEGASGEFSIGDAVDKKIINNESVAYYVGLTSRFLLDAGVDRKKLRFRQHEKNEMAHYAADCWDAEVELSFGWTEVVGIADRTCYDLEAHMKHSGQDLRAFRRFDKPRTQERVAVVPNHAKLGPRFKGQAKSIAAALGALDGKAAEGREFLEVDVNGQKLRIEKDCYTIKPVSETVNGEWFTPHVIEPSYGLDRIIYSILEHAYTEGKTEKVETVTQDKPAERDDGAYVVLRLRPKMAPIQAAVFPLIGKDELAVVAQDINARFRKIGMMTYTDDSGSIGRRYARMDEVGTPLCITVDYDGLKDGTVTIRDRDTTKQSRVPLAEVVDIVRELLDGERKLE